MFSGLDNILLAAFKFDVSQVIKQTKLSNCFKKCVLPEAIDDSFVIGGIASRGRMSEHVFLSQEFCLHPTYRDERTCCDYCGSYKLSCFDLFLLLYLTLAMIQHTKIVFCWR